MKRILKLIAIAASCLMIASCCQCRDEENVRISWDSSTYTEISDMALSNADYVETGLCYPRVKRLSDGNLLLSFMDSHYGFNIYTSRSLDNGKTWEDAVLVKHHYSAESTVGKDEVVYVNPDFIELQDGRIMIAFQWRYKNGYGDLPNTNRNCGVEIAFSDDKGASWGESREVYRGRCWEPAMLQLPSGEIQMYITSSQQIVNKGSYPFTMVIRSFDGGATWQGKECCGIDDNEFVSRTIDHRYAYDGMPTAVYLDDDKGIVVPLESWNARMVVDITPIVVRTDVKTNWKGDRDRLLVEGGPEFPMKKQVNKDMYGYGPYSCKLSSGEMLVLTNGTYRGEQGIWVLIGNRLGDNFYYATSPFDGYWGSIDDVGDNKVIGTGSEKYVENGKERYRIKIETGRLNRSKTIRKGKFEMPRLAEFNRESNDWWFLGKKSGSSAFVDFGYDSDSFIFGTMLFDSNLVAFTPGNSDASAILLGRGRDIYQIIVNAAGEYIVYKEYTRSWKKEHSGKVEVELEGTLNSPKDSDTGFAAEVRIPWSVLGGRPCRGEVLRIHQRHYIKDNNKEKPLGYYEEQEGENPDYPQEWLKVTLK